MLRYTEDGIPVVPVVVLRPPGQNIGLVLKVCPYCGEEHLHGAGGPAEDPKRFEGHRNSHCLKEVPGDKGYILEIVGEEEPPAKRKTRR